MLKPNTDRCNDKFVFRREKETDCYKLAWQHLQEMRHTHKHMFLNKQILCICQTQRTEIIKNELKCMQIKQTNKRNVPACQDIPRWNRNGDK